MPDLPYFKGFTTWTTMARPDISRFSSRNWKCTCLDLVTIETAARDDFFVFHALYKYFVCMYVCIRWSNNYMHTQNEWLTV